MSIKEATVTIKVKARFVGEDIADPTMVSAVRAAIKRYSRYNPLLVQDTLSLVDGTAVYELPEGFICMYSFEYWPAGEPTVSWTTDSLWDRAYKAALEDAKAAELSPFIEVVAKQLLVTPTPTEDTDVEYRYLAAHAVNTGGDYTTIPSVDEEIIVDLATAEVLTQILPGIALSEDFSEGLLSVRGRDRPANLTDVIRMLRRGVVNKYGGH